MAVLKSATSTVRCGLQADHLIGRSSRCDLQIDESYVSAQHAAVRWTGSVWELKDLGSRNGTLVGDQRLEPGRYHRIQKGTTIAFGRAAQTWVVEDDAAPVVMALPVDGGDPVFLEDESLAIPSAHAPEAFIARGADGSWQLERPEGVLTHIDHDETFLVSGTMWLFYCPNTVTRTAALEGRLSLHGLRLHFAVSTDEEHVELRVESPVTRIDLGSRAHNYLLLTLARHRMADAEGGVIGSACGWIYQDELLNQLAIDATRLNVDIFRIRKQFSKLDFSDTAAIIERRPRSKQLRIGVGNLVVQRV